MHSRPRAAAPSRPPSRQPGRMTHARWLNAGLSAGAQWRQAEAQPVAWINYPVICDTAGNFAGYGKAELSFTRVAYGFDINKSQPLYTAQPKAVPLTLEQIDAAMEPLYNNRVAQAMGRIDDIATARAIEAAHGIGAPAEKRGK